ncbi:MAG: glycosyltransferase family 4 protein [Bacteroidota bacterium]
MHIVFIMANNSSVPYFNWFAEKASCQNKHRLSFVALYNERPQMIDDVGKYGWNCYWIKYNPQKRKSNMITSFFKLYHLFKKIKPDVINSHLFDDSLPSIFAGRLARIKMRVITKSDTAFHYFYQPRWVFTDRFNNWNATDIITISNECMQFVIEKEKAKLSKTTMIHHGIPSKVYNYSNPDDIIYLTNKYQLKDKIVIGTVARMIEWKGYKYIIEAARLVIQKVPNAIFVFVGEGEQKEELMKLVMKYQLNNHIIFTGWLDRKLIPSFYSLLNVYAHAAHYEPFGFVIAEAMMNQTPVVSTPTGAALDAIVHKQNGYLCNYNDTENLAEGILYTLNHGVDFKEKAQQTALQMYEFDIMYQKYIKLFEG